MKKLILGIAATGALVLPAAAVAFGPSENPRAVAACERTVDRQTAKGVSAGGGPKAGIPAPTNCDHFYQSEGLIGSGQ
jgi:hypothetical protein